MRRHPLLSVWLAGAGLLVGSCTTLDTAPPGGKPTVSQRAAGDGSPEPASFTFAVGRDRYRILANGTGARNERDTLRLAPLDSGFSIDRLSHASRRDLLLLIAELTEHESGYGVVDAFDRDRLTRRWRARIPAINLGPALVTDSVAFVSGLGFVAAIDLATGSYRWKHDGLYNGYFNAFEAPVLRGSEVVFVETSRDAKPADSLRVDLATGIIVGGSRPVLGARTTGTSSWPDDRDAFQLSTEYSPAELASIPQCNAASRRSSPPDSSPARESGPLLTSDSIGPLRVGQTVGEVLERCDEGLLLWEWVNDSVATPVILVRFGDVPVTVTVDDTLPQSRSFRISVSQPGIRTRAGVGPGSSMAELRAAYGAPVTLEARDCAVLATFSSEPGLWWSILPPRGFSSCERLGGLVTRGALSPISPQSTVVRVIIGPKR